MIFQSLVALVHKDLKMFFRSRGSSAVVILIPLLIVMFAGFAFNSSGLSNVQVGVYSESYMNFTNGVISDFEKNGFVSNRYDLLESCVQSVRHSDSQICIFFPAGLNSGVSSEEIIFYVDYSRINLADSLIGQIKDSVFVKTSVVGEEMAQNLIDSLENIKVALPINKDKFEIALNSAKSNKDFSSKLQVDSKIQGIIGSLEKIKKAMNINDTGSKTEVDKLIVILKEIEIKNNKLSSDLKKSSTSQGEVISKLNGISSGLNEMIVLLSSNRVVSANDVVSPIKTRIESLSVDSNNRDYIIPIVFSLIALFGSILLSSTFVLKGKKTRAFFRNFMTPTKDMAFVFATYLTCLIILFIQFLFVFLGIQYLLKMNIIPILGPLVAILFVMFSAFVSIGMFIGYLFRSDETVIFSSMIIAALFMFFSNIILPLENISGGLMRIMQMNPLVVSNLALKKIILFGLGFGAIVDELLILGGFFVVFFLLSYVFRRLTRRML